MYISEFNHTILYNLFTFQKEEKQVTQYSSTAVKESVLTLSYPKRGRKRKIVNIGKIETFTIAQIRTRSGQISMIEKSILVLNNKKRKSF